jgi:hypothetical protein
VRQNNEDIEDLQANRCDCEEINGIPVAQHDFEERSAKFE